MTKAEKKRYDALLQRVEDIYSGAVGGAWGDDLYFIGPEELAVIVPAIMERMWPNGGAPPFTDRIGNWVSHFSSPEDCADWLWVFVGETNG